MAAPAHDNEYLKATVGPALVQALTSMVVTQPPDAVDYLGNYLIAYVEREEGKAKQAARFKELDARVEVLAAEETAAEKAALAAEEAKKPTPEEIALKTSLATSTEIAELYPDVLAACKAATGATAVYLGKKETDKAEVPVISFLTATEGCDMAGKALKGAAEGDEEATPDGVTFTLFKKLDVPEDDEPPPEEEGAPPPPPKPEPYLDQLLIENVLRPPPDPNDKDKQMPLKFFGIPMLGSYLAVPVKYKSCLHAEGVVDMTEDEIKEAEERRAAAAALAAGEGDEAAAAAAAAAAEEAAARPKVKKNVVPVEMCISMHTMGQAREYTAEELAKAKEWAGALASGLEHAEDALWEAHVLAIETAKAEDDGAKVELDKLMGDQQAAIDAELKKVTDQAELPEPEKELLQKQVFLKFAAEVCDDPTIKGRIAALGSLRVTPKPEAVKLLHAVMLFIGTPAEELVGFATDKVEWEKMRAKIDKEFVKAVVAFDPAKPPAEPGPRAAPPAATAKEMIAELTADGLRGLPTPVAYEVLLKWLQTAIDTFDKAEELRLEKEAAAKAAADAAAA